MPIMIGQSQAIVAVRAQLQRFAACGGSTTRIGDSWLGCIAYDNDNYFALNNPTDAYWVVVANDDPGFDQCNEGPPGSSHRIASASAQPRTMFKLDVVSGTDAGKHLRLGMDFGDKDFFCARTGAYEYSIPFLSVGAQNGRGNAGPVGTAEPDTPAVPAREAEEPETRSFLLTLLRALGAVHA